MEIIFWLCRPPPQSQGEVPETSLFLNDAARSRRSLYIEKDMADSVESLEEEAVSRGGEFWSSWVSPRSAGLDSPVVAGSAMAKAWGKQNKTRKFTFKAAT